MIEVIEERFVSLLQKFRKPRQLQQIQAQVVAHGLQQDEHLGPKILAALFESGERGRARRWFDGILDPNAVLWNVMFKGCTLAGAHGETLALFARMKRGDVPPNRYTFTFVLKSCAKIPAPRTGEAVHCYVIRTGFESNRFVGTTLIDVYSAAGGGGAGSAWKVFSGMPTRNVVAWTAIVAAYLAAGDVGAARRLFDRASAERDVVLWNTMVSGYIAAGDMGAARELFDRMPGRDLMSWNTVLHGYANGTDLEACTRFFEEMPDRNVYSWNGLIGGYVRHGRFFEALRAFNRMLRGSDTAPNDATLVTVLSACSKLGALDLGRWIHVYADANGFMGRINVGNVLIDMYAKCGSIESAIEVFRIMKKRDEITWNTMIGGLATHGRGAEALSTFEQMKEAGATPDGVTFVGVLSACSHMGLVQNGTAYFRSMVEEYTIVPWIEHYGCMVDLLSRSGHLNEALRFVREMPMEADCVIWTTLLGACRVHGDIRLAEVAAKQLARLQPEDATNYVVLANIYGAAGSWKDFARTKQMMKERNVEKSPGCSLIEVNYEVSEFCSSDVRHSQTQEIYRVVEGLKELSKSVECVVDLDDGWTDMKK